MFEHGVRCLAEVVSCTIDVFRKTGELSLIPEVRLCVCVRVCITLKCVWVFCLYVG